MKHIYLLLTTLLTLCVTSCKQDEWIDWKTQNEIWLEQNKSKEGVQTLPSGLQYKVIYPGNLTDTRPVTGSTVVYDYSLSLINGTTIEEQKNFSAICTSGETGLITGMVEGLKKMHVGADYMLYIPWDLAYGKDGKGTEGYSSFLPPYSTLIFEIHLSRVY